VHVTGGDRADQALAVALPDGEDQKDEASTRRLADRSQSLLTLGVGFVGDDEYRVIEQPFNLSPRNAMSAASGKFPSSQSNPDRGCAIPSRYIFVYTNGDKGPRGPLPQ